MEDRDMEDRDMGESPGPTRKMMTGMRQKKPISLTRRRHLLSIAIDVADTVVNKTENREERLLLFRMIDAQMESVD